MKASVKYRDNQNPLLRAKVPVSVLGLPFLSSVAAGDPKELSLGLSTFFESGPALKLSYHPNDASNPFTLAVKTGAGALGSPFGAAMTVSAEFSLLGRHAAAGFGASPAFFLRFKPRLGDFSITKSAVSIPARPVKVFAEPPSLPPPPPEDVNGGFDAEKTNGFHPRPTPSIWKGIDGVFSGLELNARSVLPLTDRLRLNFRWVNRFPDELGELFSETGRQRTGMSVHKIPLLIISKVSIEHSAPAKPRKSIAGASSGDDLANACRSIEKQLELLRAENGKLRKSVEEIQSDFIRPPPPGRSSESEVSRDRSGRKLAAAVGKKDRWEVPSEGKVAAVEGDVSEEFKKALLSATGAGK